MDIIKKLRNYTVILFLISVGLTAWMIWLEANNLKIMYVDQSLFNTIIASFYAVTIAVFIYWRQQKDKYYNVKKTLITFLEYLQDELSKDTWHDISKNTKELTVIFTNKSIINEVLITGNFIESTDDLIKLQGFIELYHRYTAEFIAKLKSKDDSTYLLNLIYDAQKLIDEKSSKILYSLKDSKNS